jgi:hypothetical protein
MLSFAIAFCYLAAGCAITIYTVLQYPPDHRFRWYEILLLVFGGLLLWPPLWGFVYAPAIARGIRRLLAK